MGVVEKSHWEDVCRIRSRGAGAQLQELIRFCAMEVLMVEEHVAIGPL